MPVVVFGPAFVKAVIFFCGDDMTPRQVQDLTSRAEGLQAVHELDDLLREHKQLNRQTKTVLSGLMEIREPKGDEYIMRYDPGYVSPSDESLEILIKGWQSRDDGYRPPRPRPPSWDD